MVLPTSVISALRKQIQEESHKYKASLGYISIYTFTYIYIHFKMLKMVFIFNCV